MLNISSARFASETVRHEAKAAFADLDGPVDLLDRREVHRAALPARRRIEDRARPARGTGAPSEPPIQWWIGVIAAPFESAARSPGAGCKLSHVSLLKM